MKFVKYMMFLSGFIAFGNMFGMSQAMLEDQALASMSVAAAQCGADTAGKAAEKVTEVVREVVPSVWEPAKKHLAQICVNIGAGLKNAGCKIVGITPGVLGYMFGELSEATGFLKRAPVITVVASGLVVYGGYKTYCGIKDWWNAPQQNRRR